MCHQSVSLVARHLEAAGIATVIIGSAIDIVEHCGVPRMLFVDFPLGNPCGRPWDASMQRAIVEQALGLLESASAPRTTLHADWHFDEKNHWRDRYMEITPENREALRKAGEERRAARAAR